MTRCMVTGVAGFIGSHLADRLLAEGHTVVGVDCFTDNYDRSQKEANLQSLRDHGAFRFVGADLAADDLEPFLEEIEVVFHQAGQPGVRGSWGRGFQAHLHNNVLATQRLLEAVLGTGLDLRRFVYASSSSIYGQTSQLPTSEDRLPQPHSPYGVTKLAAEHLCGLYHRNFGLPTVCLRYFTAYGPRQRPDMAFHRFVSAALRGHPLTVFGDGQQSRDFTFVADVVQANLLSMQCPCEGQVFNIGGGARVTVNAVVQLIEDLLGAPVAVNRTARQHGDVRDTWADTTKAQESLGFVPSTPIREGLRSQIEWLATGL